MATKTSHITNITTRRLPKYSVYAIVISITFLLLVCIGYVFIWPPRVAYPGVQIGGNTTSRRIGDAAFRPNTREFVDITADSLSLWSLDTLDQPLVRWSYGPHSSKASPVAVLWSHDGQFLVTGHLDPSDNLLVQVWNYSNGERLAMFQADGSGVIPLAIDVSDTLIAIGNGRTFTIWNWRTNETVALPPVDALQQYVHFSADGEWLTSESYRYRVAQWNAAPQSLKPLIGGGAMAIALHPSLPIMAVGYYSGEIELLNLDTQRVEQVVDCFQNAVGSVVFSEDGSLIAIGQGAGEYQGDSSPDIQVRTAKDLSLVMSVSAKGRGIVKEMQFGLKNEQLLVRVQDFNYTNALYADDQLWLLPLQNN